MEFTTSIPNLIIREAAETDVPLILSLVEELAEYERLTHEVEATEDILQKSLFGDHPVAEVLIGEYNNPKLTDKESYPLFR